MEILLLSHLALKSEGLSRGQEPVLGLGLSLVLWADFVVCHCNQSRGFWESQQVKEVSYREVERDTPPV